MALAAAVPTLYEYYTAGGITNGLSTEQPNFTLNDKNITIYSGAMHYFRIPKEYWRDRLRKLRAAGLNTVETYIPWNLHEPQNGVFDFGGGGSDMEDFLDFQEYLTMAQEEDLFAIVRPGPYICAEWEWGGLPSWLLREEGLQVRSSESKFMSYVQRYFGILLPLLAMLQFTNGGPIIGFQVENEYAASAVGDLTYIQQLYNLYRSNGITELLITSDEAYLGTLGTIPGLLFQTVNFGTFPDAALFVLEQMQPGKPLMVMEYWSGWYDHWSDIHQTVTNETFQENLDHILKYPASVNMYMFHGGTNWGFLNGANIFGDGNFGFQPTTTSYDYDAPLSEAGDYTGKYEIVKQLIKQYNIVETITPEPPPLIPRVAFPTIATKEVLKFDEVLSQSPDVVESENVITMEQLPINNNSGQSYGYIVYRKENIDISANAELTIKGYVYDTLMVLVNNKLVSNPLNNSSDLNNFGYWRQENSTIVLTDTPLTGATIDLVVENWGRGNFGFLGAQSKGLKDGVVLDGAELIDWKIIPLEFKKSWNQNLSGWKEVSDFQLGPAIYRSILSLEEPVDTFIDMQDWGKGVVIVNGFVLGKYATIGPQQTLYLPAPFLQPGDNDIMIFEHFLGVSTIRFSTDAIYVTK